MTWFEIAEAALEALHNLTLDSEEVVCDVDPS